MHHFAVCEVRSCWYCNRLKFCAHLHRVETKQQETLAASSNLCKYTHFILRSPRHTNFSRHFIVSTGRVDSCPRSSLPQQALQGIGVTRSPNTICSQSVLYSIYVLTHRLKRLGIGMSTYTFGPETTPKKIRAHTQVV